MLIEIEIINNLIITDSKLIKFHVKFKSQNYFVIFIREKIYTYIILKLSKKKKKKKEKNILYTYLKLLEELSFIIS